ncbi:hypothetical protein [Halospeciosus flavus]|uniref:Uncharacterized protein n=1 Tax=Halospeciosus flavus TaxID=3032283 RepID=A0ABD5Z7H2_9EURY|nr:hypothetical protein [Halospeciosus flavus]
MHAPRHTLLASLTVGAGSLAALLAVVGTVVLPTAPATLAANGIVETIQQVDQILEAVLDLVRTFSRLFGEGGMEGGEGGMGGEAGFLAWRA